MKTISTVFFAAVAALLAGCSSGESFFRVGYDFAKVQKVAVVAVEGSVPGDAARNQISDFMVGELLRKGYAPVERTQVKRILDEQKFQTSDLTSKEGVARAGRILNVPAIIVVNLPNFGEKISMTAKMLDVEDASVLWMGSGSGKTGGILPTVFGATAGAAAGGTVAGKDNRVAGAVAGGILGAVAGQALTPQQADKARDIIRDMCKKLPFAARCL